MNTKVKKTKEPSPVSHAVLFSDGSARPVNPGCIGWSVHGYTYSSDPTTKGQGHPKVAPTPKGYVDKDTKPDLIDVRNYYDFVGWKPGSFSNNAAEILGISQALHYTSTIPTLESVNIYSDSKYAIQGATDYVKTWVANNWIKRDGTEVANKDCWQELLANMTNVVKNGTKVNISWVKGHRDNFGNCLADASAAVGSEKAQVETERGEKEVISPAEGHWKNTPKRHPLVSLRGVIFLSEAQYNKPGEYYQLSQVKSDEYIGRKAVDSCIGYCQVTEPDALIEMVRNKQITEARAFNTLFLLRIDRIYDKAVSGALELFGDIVLKTRHFLYKSLFFVNEHLMVQGKEEDDEDSEKKDKDKESKHRKAKSKLIPISEELYPPMLAYRIMEGVSRLKALTEMVRVMHAANPAVGKHGNTPVVGSKELATLVDITSEYFDVEKNKKGQETTVFKKSIGVATQSIDIDRSVFGVKIRFQQIFGIHLISRTSLKALEGTNVRVWLLAYPESQNALRYLTIVMSDKDWSAWSATDSNLILTKELLEI